MATANRDGLRIGYVPEHFSTPLYFAKKYFGLPGTLHPYPSGTGHMIQSLQADEIDVGIGLTEGWVAGLGKADSKGGYKIVGTYVETPLCWAISTGAQRNDVTEVEGPQGLNGRKVGVSRIGSGSYVMSYVLADQYGWLEEGKKPFEHVVLNDFKTLREGVTDKRADFFMWEHFTTKRYYDKGELKKVGEIYTPWSSWKIVAQDASDPRLQQMAKSIDQGVAYFLGHQDEAVKYISAELDYSEDDARAWLKTVKFANGVFGVDAAVIQKTVDILGKAGVFEAEKVDIDSMIGSRRSNVTKP